MKRTLLLSLCLGAISMVASAASFTLTSNATLNAVSGVTINSSNSNSTIDFTFSSANLNGDTFTSITPDNGPFPPGIGSFFIFRLGTITLDDNEPGNANGGSFNAQVNMSYTSPLTAINAVLTPNAVVTRSGNNVTVNPSDSSRVVNFGNGGILETWMYIDQDSGSYGSFTFDDNDTHSLYMKVWLRVAPTPTTATPEPGSMALLGSGLVGIGLVARRRISK